MSVAASTTAPPPAPAAQGRQPALLFTAFEPSGDDHASTVIAALRRRHPTLPIYAWGGPRMERAGATIVERTGDAAIMGVPGIGKIVEHHRINSRVRAWLQSHDIAVHIPVDSPGANFPICKITRQRKIHIVHLVAPQMWAWGEWRVRKLRRLTDLVLCVLPFEEPWFLARGVKARFIGHPLFDAQTDFAALDRRALTFGGGSPKIAFMPGSRPAELAAFPVLLDAFRRLRADFPSLAGCVAAVREDVADQLRARASQLGGWPDGLHITAGETDAVVRWCDYALVTSGTVTLQVAKQHKPMVTFYRPNRIVFSTLVRLLVSTPYYTLPNLIAGKRIVPELIPHWGDGEDLALGIIRLMRQTGYADDQRAELAKVARHFDGRSASEAAADAIEEVAGLLPSRPTRR
ncbi:MAG: hypothetical protein KF745_01350 [Phycisphaeraceae bacterium]|nr:hypothetical protein [Phycisphaeraceae bacterium]